MARGLWEKIEWIREQPEDIRKRYVIMCLVVSMLFVIGVWLLSLKSGFQSISQDIPAAAEKGKDLLPDGQVPSFGSLLEQSAPLRVDGQDTKTGEQYFNEQFQGGEGVPSTQ
ncbi:MAG: hypothetical protein WAW00_00935 [Candidatus Moraniibacteriota bacterium]